MEDGFFIGGQFGIGYSGPPFHHRFFTKQTDLSLCFLADRIKLLIPINSSGSRAAACCIRLKYLKPKISLFNSPSTK